MMMIDIFIWDTLFGMKRKLHFSFCEKDRSGLTDDEGLAKFKKHPAIMMTGGQSTLVLNPSGSSHAGALHCIITRPSLPCPSHAPGPHHLLLPSFAYAFQAERDNIHARMGVNLDEIFTAAATILFYIPLLRDLVITLGGRIASPEVLSGMKMFALAPGGIHEMIRYATTAACSPQRRAAPRRAPPLPSVPLTFGCARVSLVSQTRLTRVIHGSFQARRPS